MLRSRQLLYSVLIGATLLVTAAQCGGPTGEQIPGNNHPTTGLERIIDQEAGVVCFYVVYSRSVAVDCMPLVGTNLVGDDNTAQ